MEKMNAIVWQDKELKFTSVDVPEVRKKNDVKVKIYGTGICGTDLNVLKDKLEAGDGMILGHEAVGVIEEIGEDVSTLSVGDRVIIDPTQFCGKCTNCRTGLTCYCEEFDDWQLGIGAHGTFADYYVGEERFMYKIPDSMNWDRALFVEPLSCVLNAIEKCNIQPWDSVLVIGGGPIGQLCQLVASKLSKITVATELNDYRRTLAKNISGYAYRPEDLTEDEINSINSFRKFDVVIDAVGNQMDYAFKMVEKGGRILPMGFDETFEYTIKPFEMLSKGITIIGTGEVRQITTKAIRLINNLPEVESLISNKYPLKDFKHCFDHLLGKSNSDDNRNEMKIILLSNVE